MFISANSQAGLYEKWSREQLAAARLVRAREQAVEQDKEEGQTQPATPNSRTDGLLALTLTHMQGPFVIVLLGWITGALVFALEWIGSKIQ